MLGAGGVALLLGVFAAAALKNILFKVNALDPTIYFAVAGLLTLVAAMSCFRSRAPRDPGRSGDCSSLRVNLMNYLLLC